MLGKLESTRKSQSSTEEYLSRSSMFSSFMPDGMMWAPGKRLLRLGRELVLVLDAEWDSWNSPGRRPENSDLMILRRMVGGRWYDDGKRYHSLPRQRFCDGDAAAGCRLLRVAFWKSG